MHNEIPRQNKESETAQTTHNRWAETGRAALEASEANTIPIRVTIEETPTDEIPVDINRDVQTIRVNNRHGNAVTNVDFAMVDRTNKRSRQAAAERYARRQAAALEDTNPNMPIVKPDEPWYNELPYGVNRPQQHP